jgi:hypothetical protein
MRWRESWRADPAGRRIADNHYNRQKVGADQFVPPGRCVVLVIHDADQPEAALWVTSWPFPEYVKHAWPGAWVCSTFRNQLRDPAGLALHRSSELTTEALAATRWYWEPPPQGIITFIDPKKTKHKRDPGRCFLKAGFHVSGKAPANGTHRPVCICDGMPAQTEGGLVALHMARWQIPPARQPLGAQSGLGIL